MTDKPLENLFRALAGPKPSPDERAKVKFDSAEHELFSRWRWQEISDADYFTNNALLMVSKWHLHAPVPVSMPPEAVRIYALDRAQDKRTADAVTSKKLSRWLAQYTDDVSENTHRYKCWHWARVWLEKSGNKAEAEKVTEYLSRFDRIRYADPLVVGASKVAIKRDSVEGVQNERR